MIGRWVRFAILAVGIVIGVFSAPGWGPSAAIADEAADACDVPADIVLVNYPYDRVYGRLKEKGLVKILVVGSNSSVSSTAWASKGLTASFKAFPRLLEGELLRRQPSLRVWVVDKTAAGQTAAMVVAQMGRLIGQTRPDLVVWETGTTDAVRKIDLNAFGDAVAEGLRTIHDLGADALLVDIQYSPQTESIYDFQSYLDYLWRVGEAGDANVLHRYEIMRSYIENGKFDPAAQVPADQLRNANFVHGCLARLMASMILAAAQQP